MCATMRFEPSGIYCPEGYQQYMPKGVSFLQSKDCPGGATTEPLWSYIAEGVAQYMPSGAIRLCQIAFRQRSGPEGARYVSQYIPKGPQYMPKGPFGAMTLVAPPPPSGFRPFGGPLGNICPKGSVQSPEGGKRIAPKGQQQHVPPAPKGAVCARPFGERINILPLVAPLRGN